MPLLAGMSLTTILAFWMVNTCKVSEREAKGLEIARQVQNKYIVHSRLHMIDLGTIFERCLNLRESVSHPGSPLDTAALEQFNLILVHVSYVRNPYATPGVYLPSDLWVQGG